MVWQQSTNQKSALMDWLINALAYIEGSQLVIFFPLTEFDRCRVVVFYKDLPLTDKKRRLFDKKY